MDSPNVTINDLFDNIRSSLKKYEARQKLSKQQRECRRLAHTYHGVEADTKPLFVSQLLIKKCNKEDDNSSKKTSSTNGSSTHEDSDDDADIHNHGGGLSKLTKKSVPEFIPLCERQRRAETEAILRSKSSQLNHNGMTFCGATVIPKFKPLVWNKPSFALVGESSASTATMIDSSSPGSSSFRRQGKRKTLRSSGITSGPNTIIGVYERHYNPMYKRQKWTKEEVDSLVDFADKWIAPDVKKQRTR